MILFQGCAGNKKHSQSLEFPERTSFGYTRSNGRYLEIIVTRGDPLAVLIENCFKNNTYGWSKSWDTFVPGFQYRAPNFVINVRSDFIVASIKQADGDWIQIKKQTPVNLWKEICEEAAIESTFTLQR